MENTIQMSEKFFVGQGAYVLVNDTVYVHISQFNSYYSYSGVLIVELLINRYDPRIKGRKATIRLAPSKDGNPGEEIVVAVWRSPNAHAPKKRPV